MRTVQYTVGKDSTDRGYVCGIDAGHVGTWFGKCGVGSSRWAGLCSVACVLSKVF